MQKNVLFCSMKDTGPVLDITTPCIYYSPVR